MQWRRNRAWFVGVTTEQNRHYRSPRSPHPGFGAEPAEPLCRHDRNQLITRRQLQFQLQFDRYFEPSTQVHSGLPTSGTAH